MRKTCILGTVMLVLVLIQGCAPGYNSVLFATRSNVGFDADTAPPNLEIAVSRYEGVFEPTFEGGQTVPVMASFSSESNAFTNFFWGVKSTFATGEAAFVMSYLYDDAMPLKDDKGKDKVCYERVTLSKMPDPKLPFGCKVQYVKAGEVKPVLFGTDTILGIKIKWSGQTAQYPSSVNIGFKRTEATLAPIAVGANRIADPNNPNNINNKKYEADIASLLATIDTNVSASENVKFTYLQYFATGSAASNLARRHEVREAMLRRSYPDQKIQTAEEGKALKAANRAQINNVFTIFDKVDDNKKNAILTEAKTLKLVDDEVTIKNFKSNLAIQDGGKSPIPENLKVLADFASKNQ